MKLFGNNNDAGTRKEPVRKDKKQIKAEKKRRRDAEADKWAIENELFDDDNP